MTKSYGLRTIECCGTCWWDYAGEGCRYYTENSSKFCCNKYQSATGGMEGLLIDYEKKVIRPKPDVWE